MGKHEKPVSGTSRKSEARLPRAERTPSVREEELLFDIPETAERVTAHAAETLPEEPAAPVPAESFEAPSPIPEESFETPAPIRKVARPAQEAAPVRRERPVSEEKPVRRERPAQDSEPVRRERPVQEDKPARRERPAPEEKPARRERPAQETKSARRERPARAENPAADEEIVPKNRKKKGGFRKGLLTYVLVVAVIFLAALIVLWVALARFQKNKEAEKAAEAEQNAIVLQEKQHAEAVRQAPQRAFEAWLASYTADDWTNLWYERPENIDGRDRVRAYMEERFGSGSVQAFRSLDYTDEAPAYVLKDGDEALARVTLSGSDVNWAVSDVELELEGTKSASVEVAVGSKVFCNGTELGSEYAGEPQNNFSYEPLKDKLINPVSWTTYTVDGLLIEPELTAEPPAGCSVTKTAEGDFMLCLDGADAEKYTTRAVSFVKAYLTYYMNGYNGTWGNLYAALAYLTPGTQAYTDLQDTYNGVVWNTAYGNIDVSNTTASGVVIWADNCYSVDVTYDANCTHNGQAIDYADATMRIYFLQTDAGFVISNYETL